MSIYRQAHASPSVRSAHRPHTRLPAAAAAAAEEVRFQQRARWSCNDYFFFFVLLYGKIFTIFCIYVLGILQIKKKKTSGNDTINDGVDWSMIGASDKDKIWIRSEIT